MFVGERHPELCKGTARHVSSSRCLPDEPQITGSDGSWTKREGGREGGGGRGGGGERGGGGGEGRGGR